MRSAAIRRLAAHTDAGIVLSGDDIPAGVIADVVDITRETGAPRSRVLRAVADAIDDNESLARDVILAATSARASARVLALLPGVTAVVAGFLGTNSLGFLFGSVAGWACIALGVGSTVVGWWWMNRLIKSIHPPAIESGVVVVVVAEILSVTALTGEAAARVTHFAASWGRIDEWSAVCAIRHDARESGIPVVGLLRAHAEEERRRFRFDVRRRIEELPGKLLVPLGVCLFPAFITLTVLPAIGSMAIDFFASGN